MAKLGLLATLPYKLSSPLNDRHRLTRIKTNADRLSRSHAADTITNKALLTTKPETPTYHKRSRA